MTVLGTEEVRTSNYVMEEYHKTLGQMDEDLDPVDGANTRFFDVFSMHALRELWLISRICHAHLPERIVEYGTAMGGLTRCFGRWAHVTGAKVLSIENEEYSQLGVLPESFRDTMNGLPIEFYEGNEYHQETYDRVQEFVSDKKTLFYCDGGNKPMELKWCAAIMDSRDLLLCHDYDLSEDEQKSITLNPILAAAGHVSVERAQQIMDMYDLEQVYEKYLGKHEGDERRYTHILALRKKAG